MSPGPSPAASLAAAAAAALPFLLLQGPPLQLPVPSPLPAPLAALQRAAQAAGGTPSAWASSANLPPLESPALKLKRLDTFPEALDGNTEDGRQRIRKPKSGAAGRCAQACVTTCVRGGAGAPGEGPFNVRKPLVVFKEGFRSRKYCLSECTDICNLLPEPEDGR